MSRMIIVMFVGFWDVSSDGEGTLDNLGVGDASGASLDAIGTISVRRVVDLSLIGLGLEPLIVEACGEVESDDDD